MPLQLPQKNKNTVAILRVVALRRHISLSRPPQLDGWLDVRVNIQYVPHKISRRNISMIHRT
jgi:hypothetical protein